MEIIIFVQSVYPESRIFTEENKKLKKANFWTLLFIRTQWFFILLFVAGISFYIALVLIWLLLGAIIDPNVFLVYTSSAGTLITFVTAKFNSFIEIAKEGFEKVHKYSLYSLL